MEIKLISRTKMFNGHQESYRHFSAIHQCDTSFHIYQPPQMLKHYAAPVLYFLSDAASDGIALVQQSGIQRFAAQWNIAIVFANVSPPCNNIATHCSGDLTQQPQAYRYISQELPDLIEHHFCVTNQRSISGFGTGGADALHIALSNTDAYVAASAFAPCGLSIDEHSVQQTTKKRPLLIDQGDIDTPDSEVLAINAVISAARAAGFHVLHKKRSGYGHNYAYVASFIDTHVEFHADALGL